jgi:hypothetical protein
MAATLKKGGPSGRVVDPDNPAPFGWPEFMERRADCRTVKLDLSETIDSKSLGII